MIQPCDTPIVCDGNSPKAALMSIGLKGKMTRRSAPDGLLQAITHMATMIVALVMMLPGPTHADELGRLFFTPQQRQDLDRRRATNAQAAVVTAVDQVTVNGQVLRSGGKSTTWINGAPQDDIRAKTDAKDPTRVTVRQGEETQGSSLRVGETLDRVRGETRDGLDGGKIVIKRERK